MSTDSSVAAGVLSIAAFVIFITAWWLIDRHDTAVVERMMRADFKAHMDAYQPDAWDGDTWDWPEGHLAEYFFGQEVGYPVLAASDLPPQTDPGHTTATDRATPDHLPASATSRTFSGPFTGRAETFPAERPTDTYLASQPTSPALVTPTDTYLASQPTSPTLVTRQARTLASRVTLLTCPPSLVRQTDPTHPGIRQADLRPSEPVRRTDAFPLDPSSADVPNRTGLIQAPPPDGTDLPCAFPDEPAHARPRPAGGATYPSCPLPPGHPGRLANSSRPIPADALIRHGSATDMPQQPITSPADVPYSLVPFPAGMPAISDPPPPADMPQPPRPFLAGYPFPPETDPADYPGRSGPARQAETSPPAPSGTPGPPGVTDTDLFIMMLREKAGQFIEQKITGASRYAPALA